MTPSKKPSYPTLMVVLSHGNAIHHRRTGTHETWCGIDLETVALLPHTKAVRVDDLCILCQHAYAAAP